MVKPSHSMHFSPNRTVARPLGSLFNTQSPVTSPAQFSSSQAVPHLPPVSSSDTTVSVTRPEISARKRWR
jgi:hypothetical protein